MKKSKIFAPVAAVAALALAGCSPAAETASRNISYESDNFKVMRRIVFVNGITDKYLPVGMVPGTRQVQVYFRPDK